MFSLLLLPCVLSSALPGGATALVPAHGEQVSPVEAEQIQALARAELERAGGIKLQSAADTLLGLDQAHDAGWTCRGEAACLAQLGKSLGVTNVIHSELSVVPGGLRLALQSVDVSQAAITARATSRLPADPAHRTAAIQRAVRNVLGRGHALVIHNGVPEALVELDGEPLELASGETVVGGLAPGAHTLRISGAGLPPVEETVVAAGRDPPAVHIGAGALRVRVGGQPVTSTSSSPGGSASSPILPLGLLGGGAAGAELAVVASLVGTTGLVLGAALLGTLAREPGSQRIMARDGQTRAQLQAQLVGGQLLLAVGALSVGGAVVVALVAAGLGAAGLLLGLTGAP
ncbi:MAG: hypothetical protein AB2A00_11765 [Myxococcota bacterium]